MVRVIFAVKFKALGIKPKFWVQDIFKKCNTWGNG